MMIDNIDLNAIQDENARELIRRLLNLIEKLSADLRDAQLEIQRLRDEVNRLKGEQGKPKSKGNTPKPPPVNHSSEDVLCNGRKRLWRLNEETFRYLSSIPWSKAVWRKIQSWKSEQDWEGAAFLERLDEGALKLSKQQRKTLIDAAAVTAYPAQKDYPVVQALVCDDAPQFNWLGQEMMLCWVHEDRHYKKLIPVIALHRELLDNFLKQFWEYYHLLLDYCQNPAVQEHLRLETAFDDLFSTHTGYDALDQRIDKTNAKKDSLLLVLQYPELPLHNNASELGVRSCLVPDF